MVERAQRPVDKDIQSKMHGGPSLTRMDGGSEDKRAWIGHSAVLGHTQTFRHMLVTIALLGLSLVWSTEFAQAGPYLLNLGLSKSATSLVFLAGPLAGECS